MNGEERRTEILKMIQNSAKPVSGSKLAETFQVSRQVIVQDIALIRAQGIHIYSTSRGYILGDGRIRPSRIFKVHHNEDQVMEELNICIDNGGCVEDVFVYHKVYGVLRANLNFRSRRDVRKFMDELQAGKSTLLLNVTSGYHYHTVSADSLEALDDIQKELENKGFLAKLVDYEPVDFWNEGEKR